MKLFQLLQSFEFDELFPSVVAMYPNAKRHRKEFKQAFDMLITMRYTPTNKQIQYLLIEDGSGDCYFGAHDSNFKANWDVLLGKDIVRSKGVTLTDEEMAANCLLNIIFLGNHPKDFNDSYNILRRA